MKLNMDYFVEELWEHLGLIRVYTKRQGKKPDFEDPLILRGGCSIEHVVSLNCMLTILFCCDMYALRNFDSYHILTLLKNVPY